MSHTVRPSRTDKQLKTGPGLTWPWAFISTRARPPHTYICDIKRKWRKCSHYPPAENSFGRLKCWAGILPGLSLTFFPPITCCVALLYVHLQHIYPITYCLLYCIHVPVALSMVLKHNQVTVRGADLDQTARDAIFSN